MKNIRENEIPDLKKDDLVAINISELIVARLSVCKKELYKYKQLPACFCVDNIYDATGYCHQKEYMTMLQYKGKGLFRELFTDIPVRFALTEQNDASINTFSNYYYFENLYGKNATFDYESFMKIYKQFYHSPFLVNKWTSLNEQNLKTFQNEVLMTEEVEDPIYRLGPNKKRKITIKTASDEELINEITIKDRIREQIYCALLYQRAQLQLQKGMLDKILSNEENVQKRTLY